MNIINKKVRSENVEFYSRIDGILQDRLKDVKSWLKANEDIDFIYDVGLSDLMIEINGVDRSYDTLSVDERKANNLPLSEDDLDSQLSAFDEMIHLRDELENELVLLRRKPNKYLWHISKVGVRGFHIFLEDLEPTWYNRY